VTPAQRAARERKQKIFVVVGGLFLVAMLAIQLPKLLGGSSPEAAPTTTTDAAGLPVQVAPPGTTDVALVAASPESAKITSFSVFTAKDPFVQQVATQPPVAGTDAGGVTSQKGGAGATTHDKNGGPADGGQTKPFTTGKAPVAAATIVTVNGVRQVLEAGMRFPSADPLFVLVAEKPGSRAVVVGIVGGAYAGGAKSTTLHVGKPLTLVNTTTGAKYRIALVSVGNGAVAEGVPPQP
jgi:hypothetical protein